MYLLVKSLLLPPGLFIIVAILVWFLIGRFPRVAQCILGLQILLFYLLSTNYVVTLGARLIEPHGALTPAQLSAFQPQAIVVLGTARAKAAPEFSGRDTVGPDLLVRVRYAAKLWRETGLPILVSGGSGYDHREPEAELMARVLEQAFAVPVRWRERASLTTWENALFSERILSASGVQRILLVTQAYHMPRSVDSFSSTGLQVLAAPTGFINGAEDRALSYRQWLPTRQALATNMRLLHELIGSVYYRGRYYR